MPHINKLIGLHEKQIEILKTLRQYTDPVCRESLIEMYATCSKEIITMIDNEDETLQQVFGATGSAPLCFGEVYNG